MVVHVREWGPHPSLSLDSNHFLVAGGRSPSPYRLEDLDLGEIGGNLTWLPPVDDSEVGQIDGWAFFFWKGDGSQRIHVVDFYGECR